MTKKTTTKLIDINKLDSPKLLKGDSSKLIKRIPDSSIDLILIDPPYNLSSYSTGNMDFKWRKTINNDLADWDKETFIPQNWQKEFTRILSDKGNIFAFCSYNLIGEWHKTFDPIFDTFQFFVWHKTNPPPKFRKAGFLNSCELVVCMWNKGHTWNFGKQNEMHNFIESPICMGKERVKNPTHPTQKPLKVLDKLVQISTNEGDVILDCFMGVGSTGVSAINQNRKFIGFEIDGDYFNQAKKRIKNISNQAKLDL